MRIPIPMKFKLFGQTVRVSYNTRMSFDESGLQGEAKYRGMGLILQPSTESAPIPQDTVEHNFFHELVHHIFSLAGEDGLNPPLHHREYLVDRVAGLLHQTFKTAEYEKEGKKKNVKE